MTFTVTLDRHGLVDPPTREWLDPVGAADLRPHAQCALAMVRRAEFLDDQVLPHQLAIDTRDAQALPARLVGEGWLVNPVRRGETYMRGPRLVEADQTPALMPSPPGGRARSARARIDGIVLAALDAEEPRTVHDVVEATSLPISSVRRRLAVLVDQGQVRATAPAISRSRAYLRAAGH